MVIWAVILYVPLLTITWDPFNSAAWSTAAWMVAAAVAQLAYGTLTSLPPFFT